MRYLFWIIAFLIAPLLAHAQQTQEEEDQSYIASLIEDNLSGVSREVNIIGFQGALSSEATIDVLTVADAEGVWLTLEDITLIWTRSALLRGAIDVDEISAERIVVSRPPVSEDTGPSPEAQPFSLPELPVSVSLQQLQIGRIELGEAFLGEPVAISLRGTAELSGGEGSANVVAERLGDKRGIFEINGSYANETRVLGLLLNLEEGPDGIAARILDLPGRPAIGLRVEGDAPIDDFAATLAISTAGEDRLTGDFVLTDDGAERLITLDVGGDITPLFDPAYQSFFGNDAQLYVEARQTNDGRIDVSSLSLESQRLNLSGALQVGAQGWPERIRLSGGIVRGSEPVLLPIAGPETFVSSMRLAINYDGSQSDDWTATISVEDFDRPGLFIDELGLEGGGVLRNGEGDLEGLVTATLNYGARGLELDDAGASQALGDAVTGTFEASRAEGEPTEIARFTLSGAGIEARAQATIQGPRNGLQTNATATATVTGLGRFSTLIGQDIGGAAELTALADVTPLDGLFAVTLAGRTDNLSVGIPQADALLAGAGNLSASAVRDADGTRLESLLIRTDAAQITARAELTSDGSDAEFSARLNDIAVVLPELDGPAQVSGTVQAAADGVIDFDITGTGPAAQLEAQGTVNPTETGQTVNAALSASVGDLSRYADLAQRPLSGAARFTLGGVLLTDGLRFDVDIAGQTTNVTTGIERLDPFLEGAGQFTAAVARPTASVFQVSDLLLTTPAVRVAGGASIDGLSPTGADLDLRINDARLIDPSLSGPITARIDAVPTDQDTLAVDITANGPGVAVTLDADVAQPSNEISGDLTAQVDDLAAYQALIGQPVSGSVDLAASGSVVPDLSRFDAKINLRSENLAIGNPTVDVLLRERAG